MSNESADVVVIGGGAIGSSIAWNLTRRGAGNVVLLEKAGIASGGTGWSSAIIRQHYTHEVLARMALESLHIFQNFADIVGSTAEFHNTGFLVLVKPEDADPLRANVAMHQRVGIESVVLSAAEVRELEPRIETGDIVAAAWEPQSGYADPVATATGFADAARRGGASIRTGVAVEEILTDSAGVTGVRSDLGVIETRTVVVAAGYRAKMLVEPLGLDLPLTPVRHDIGIVARTSDFGPRPPIISDRINGSYFRPEGAELTMIGTTAPFDGHIDENVEATREPFDDDTEKLITRFWNRFPTQENATLRKGYTGIYDCSPDLQPLLGPVGDIPGLHLATGFSGHGLKLSPVVGDLIAEQIVDGRTSLVDIDFFSPARFAAGRQIASTRTYSVGTLG